MSKKEPLTAFDNLAILSSKERFSILAILYSSKVLKIGPEFKEKKK